MLKLFSKRRGCLVAIWLCFLLVGLLLWSLPEQRTMASKLIGKRVGLDTEVDDVHWSFGGVDLEGVQLRGANGGIVARIDRVRVQMNLIAALFKGARAVRRVSAEGGDCTIDLREEGLARSLAQARSRLSAASPPSAEPREATRPAPQGRLYELTGLTLRVLDAHGSLLLIRGLSVQKESRQVTSTVSETTLGSDDGDYAHAGPTTLALRWGEQGWQLRDLEVQEATVKLVPQGDSSEKSLARRVRGALLAFRPTEPPGSIAEDAEGSPSSPVAQPTHAARGRWLSRLCADADIAVSGLQVESRTSAGRIERLRNFELGLRGDDRGSFRISAAGRTTRQGEINVDLTVRPSDARAEGTLALRRISLALVAPFLPDLPLYHTEASTIDAELDLASESADSVRISGRVEARELAVASERIAPNPVEHINVEVGGHGAWYPSERRLHIAQGKVRLGRAQVMIEGDLERTPEHYRVELTAQLPPTDCNDVVSAIPRDILGSLSAFEWSGTWSAVARLSLDSRNLEATDLSLRVRNLCHFERAPAWVRIERFRRPFRHRMIEPDGSTFEMRTGPGTRSWVALADVSPFVAPAVISHEDGAFFEHGGFAPWAIRDAMVRNLEEGRYVVGASTISMQLAKNLYLEREKNIARKVQEVILTWWLEEQLTKDEILELYLNVIEYGPGVYGLRYAAAYYFGREPSQLSPAESAFLACMLPSPTRYHVSYERGALTRSMKGRMRRLLEHMAKRERIGPEALAYGLGELDDFRFHRMGDPPPAPRTLPPVDGAAEPHPGSLDPFEALFVSP